MNKTHKTYVNEVVAHSLTTISELREQLRVFTSKPSDEAIAHCKQYTCLIAETVNFVYRMLCAHPQCFPDPETIREQLMEKLTSVAIRNYVKAGFSYFVVVRDRNNYNILTAHASYHEATKASEQTRFAKVFDAEDALLLCEIEFALLN